LIDARLGGRFGAGDRSKEATNVESASQHDALPVEAIKDCEKGWSMEPAKRAHPAQELPVDPVVHPEIGAPSPAVPRSTPKDAAQTGQRWRVEVDHGVRACQSLG
jgi:hypothetical protein